MDRHIHGVGQIPDAEPGAQMGLQMIQDRPLAVKATEGIQILITSGSLFKKVVDQALKYRLQIKKASDRFLLDGSQNIL